jgi:hypothetical protein
VEALKKGALRVMAEGFLSVMIVEEFQRQDHSRALEPPIPPPSRISQMRRGPSQRREEG